MRYLLDTHTFLWFIGGSRKLSGRARELIEDSTNECLVSAAGIWEIAIKCSLGKIRVNMPLRQLVIDQVDENGFAILPVTQEHSIMVATLRFHHRDPFDRILIAQSLVEKFDIIGVDKAFDDYAIRRVW